MDHETAGRLVLGIDHSAATHSATSPPSSITLPPGRTRFGWPSRRTPTSGERAEAAAQGGERLRGPENRALFRRVGVHGHQARPRGANRLFVKASGTVQAYTSRLVPAPTAAPRCSLPSRTPDDEQGAGLRCAARSTEQKALNQRGDRTDQDEQPAPARAPQANALAVWSGRTPCSPAKANGARSLQASAAAASFGPALPPCERARTTVAPCGARRQALRRMSSRAEVDKKRPTAQRR